VLSRVLQAGKMFRPTAMDIDAGNNAVYVVEQYNHRVSKWIYSDDDVDFKLDAGQVTTLSLDNIGSGYTNPTLVFSAPDLDIANPVTATGTIGESGGALDSLVLTDGGNGYSTLPTVTVVDLDGVNGVVTATVITTPWGSNGNGTSGVPGKPTSDTDNNLQFPTGIARLFATTNRLFISDTLNHRVRVMDPDDGSFTDSMGSPGTGDGELYRPVHLADNEADNELAVMDSRNHRVAIFNSTTFAFVGIANPPTPDNFHTPWGAKYRPNNSKFYYSDIIKGKVYQYDNSGLAFESSFGTPGTDPADPNQLFYPGASNGTPQDNTEAYLPDTRNNKIKIYNSSNIISDIISGAGTGDGELYWPEHATAYQNNGTADALCVCNTLNNRIEVYDRNDPSTFLTNFGSP